MAWHSSIISVLSFRTNPGLKHRIISKIIQKRQDHMSRYSKKKTVSPETQDEALAIAKANQRPGQSKEQTRLIAQGIQKGIDQYKKKQKSKSRELDKKLKKAQQENVSENKVEIKETVTYRQHWLPWLLLVLSWLAAGFYFFGG